MRNIEIAQADEQADMAMLIRVLSEMFIEQMREGGKKDERKEKDAGNGNV